MPLPPPQLDDRSFDDLVEEAVARVRQACPGWTDLGASDPGLILLELFAHLTETMIYRLNQLPDKAYVEFLNLIGVRLHAPEAARVTLRFQRSAPGGALVIPEGTRVTVERAGGTVDGPVFATAQAATIPTGATEAGALALHCEVVAAELAGRGSGQPGLSLLVAHPPVVAPTGDGLDVVVGVEVGANESVGRAVAREFQGRTYRVWREVADFTDVGADPHVYTVDRMEGRITFAPAVQLPEDDGRLEAAPAALAAVPLSGREVRVWYRRGGGGAGNVAAGALTTMKDPIPGVEVTNPAPATGGRDAETLANALLRGPRQLRSTERVVTARDFQRVAMDVSGAVQRAVAFPHAELWRHGVPGTVQVLLVPSLGRDPGEDPVTAAELTARHTEEARAEVQRELDQRRPLGVTCQVDWVRYKTVRVRARVVVHREESAAAVERRVLARLNQTISPVPTGANPAGWRFGQPLRSSDVFRIVMREPGVRYVEDVRLLIDDVPSGAVECLAADHFQEGTWYAGRDETLYRSINDGESWEPAGRFPGETVRLVKAHPDRPGLLAVSGSFDDGGVERARLHFSTDCGESWQGVTHSLAAVRDMAWVLSDGAPLLLLATDAGLLRVGPGPGEVPVELPVWPDRQGLPLFAVAATTDVDGGVDVAVAAQGGRGVFLASGHGPRALFRPIGLHGEDVRVLAVQRDGPRRFLWAGLAAARAGDEGAACRRWELRGFEEPPDRWRALSDGWKGGSVRSLAFLDGTVLAGSHHAGVLRLHGAGWQAPGVGSGLPLRDPGRFVPATAVAASPDGHRVLAGTRRGVYRALDGGVAFEDCSGSELTDTVTLPATWLFASGEHQLEVVSEDAVRLD